MATDAQALPVIGATSDPVTRRRIGLLAIAIALTSVAAIAAAALFWPTPATGQWYTYSDIAPIRDRWWGLLVFLGANLVINVPAQALATLLLVRSRGSSWATAGAALMWVGAGLYAVGAGGWATIYFFPTDPALDPGAATQLLDRVSWDPHLFAIAIPGAVLVALGTAVQAAALWLSRAVPRWVPILSLAVVPSLAINWNEFVWWLVEVSIAVAATAIGYYAWRRASAGLVQINQ